MKKLASFKHGIFLYTVLVLLIFAVFVFILGGSTNFLNSKKAYTALLEMIQYVSQNYDVPIYLENNEGKRHDLDDLELKKIIYYISNNLKPAKLPAGNPELFLYIDNDKLNLFKIDEETAIVNIKIQKNEYTFQIKANYLWFYFEKIMKSNKIEKD